ncbi:MAG TPA: DUF29 domain-containing protein [Acetobacteraceae bacterium]|jgi:hypothetical protein|nr:DUF29 domain-containing protein [Acetobacteraceae bacterium]
MSDLYDTDIVLWSERQSGLLRRRAAGELVNEAELDWSNIAEEIESLGRNQARELASRLAAVILHLMKLQASPASDPRAGWRDTVQEQRDEIDRLLLDAPTLRGRIPAIIARELERARHRARTALPDHDEQSRVDLDTIVYTEDEVLGHWLP